MQNVKFSFQRISISLQNSAYPNGIWVDHKLKVVFLLMPMRRYCYLHLLQTRNWSILGLTDMTRMSIAEIKLSLSTTVQTMAITTRSPSFHMQYFAIFNYIAYCEVATQSLLPLQRLNYLNCVKLFSAENGVI